MAMTKEQMQTPRTLCWCCRRSYLKSCSWADDFTPVPGWHAIEGQYTIPWGDTGRTERSYCVLSCPLFKDDAPEGSGERTYYAKAIEEGAHALAAAIIKQAIDDYLDYYKVYIKLQDEVALANAHKIERWIMSDMFSKISNIDPEWLIGKMKKKARMMAMKKVRAKK